ncbi:P1 family peptidase [Clostridium sp. C8-1-8]|uniref:P1 family peptidase n=1 Tax=Clostridium sp. C8-1-8 TaxID=2698831 RepID=UPI001367F597|nr:P1 family peptidase [Clostridium sp. C8-1-8]
MKEINFLDIDGIRMGHSQNFEAGTGCTVVICEAGASAGVDVRGGAPGTRETDLLNPTEMVDKIHAVVLSGGSAFGLDAASGVMKYLENHDIGFDVSVTKVPIVCQAVLFDLVCGNGKVRPDKKMGFDACINSENYKEDINGNIGAGTGATVGKILGPQYSMKGGLGTYAMQVGELKVGAVVAVNCLGDVIDPSTNEIIAGALDSELQNFVNTEEVMISQYSKKNNVFNGNTTIGIIVTNAILTKAEANKIASMAHNGFGRTMRPAHTMVDGDTIFTMATNKVQADINVVGLLAARVMEKAILKGVKNATSDYGFKAYSDKIK